MTESELPPGFLALTSEKQREIREGGQAIVRFAYDHVFPISVASPPSANRPEEFHSGSGFFVRIGGRAYLATADHVLDHYLVRRNVPGGIVMQAAEFRLWPEERPTWRDRASDIAFVEITEAEARKVGRLIVDPPMGWPPRQPVVGSYVMYSGFPAYVRERSDAVTTHFNALSSLMRVATVGEGYFVCQFERDEWVNFSQVPVPEPGTSLGGMSGGPVFANGRLAFPLVGLISEFSASYELLYVKSFESVPQELPTTVLEPKSNAV
jgi:hypothetical protein